MTDKFVTLAHGAGGKQTSELIDRVFKEHFANPDLTADDAAVLSMEKGKIAFTTDGFIVSPYEFAGGNIGKLSICGTVNDLSCMGAKPLYLSCAFVIEEGFPMYKLEEIAAAMAKTAKEAGVEICAGDTKVAGKGQVDGVFITTLPALSSVTSPMIAAFSEFLHFLRAETISSALSFGANITSLPSQARYNGSKPSIPHTPFTSSATGIFSASRVIPTPL